MLKYTPEHVTCMATFWGPLTKPGTGFLAVQDLSTRQVSRCYQNFLTVPTKQYFVILKKKKVIYKMVLVSIRSLRIHNHDTYLLFTTELLRGCRFRAVFII